MCPAYPADPERPQPPARLRDEHPPRRPRPGSSRDGPEYASPGGWPPAPARNPPTSRRPPPVRPSAEARDTQALDIDMVQERGEPRILVRCCHSAHTIQPTERALSGTVSGARFAGRVPLGRSASLHRLRRPALGVVRQLPRYYRTVRLLTIVHHGITASAFPARPAPPSRQAGDHEISRFSA